MKTLRRALPKARLVRRVPLRFGAEDAGKGPAEPLHADLSSITTTDGGACLWMASDETVTVERLSATRGKPGDVQSYGRHKSYDLHDFLPLDDDVETEADLEGLVVDGGYLWVVGSHSLVRKRPKPREHDAEEALERLSRIRDEPNRYLLARIPLVPGDAGGEQELATEGPGERRAGMLKMKGGRNSLAKVVAKDEHFGPFLNVPAKENGFDIEGIAVRGEQVLLGLRGPVLRGWAMVLELSVFESRPGRLKLRKLDTDGCRYRKHFLYLDGLGIRDLIRDGDHLLILAGPTMDLDGPVRLYRWEGAFDAVETSRVVSSDGISVALDLPFGEDGDHAEGVTLLPGRQNGSRRLLTVYDSPMPERVLPDKTGIYADLFTLPDAGTGKS